MTHAKRIQDTIIFQTDPRLTAMHNRYGCRLMCLIAIPQYVTGRALTVEQILDITERGKDVEGAIVSDTLITGRAEDWLINEAFKLLGSGRRGIQVGWNAAHLFSRKWEYMIGHWRTRGDDGHFTLFDRRQVEIYDPHNPAQAGYTIDKQDIQRRLMYRTWDREVS